MTTEKTKKGKRQGPHFTRIYKMKRTYLPLYLRPNNKNDNNNINNNNKRKVKESCLDFEAERETEIEKARKAEERKGGREHPCIWQTNPRLVYMDYYKEERKMISNLTYFLFCPFPKSIHFFSALLVFLLLLVVTPGSKPW